MCISEVLDGFGGQWLEPETDNVGLDSSASLKAASWLRELISSGASPKAVINYAENEALQAFKSGDVALMRNWPYAWAELQKQSSHVKGKVGVTNMVSLKGHPSTATLGSWGLSILRSSTSKEEAYEVIINGDYDNILAALSNEGEFIASAYADGGSAVIIIENDI